MRFFIRIILALACVLPGGPAWSSTPALQMAQARWPYNLQHELGVLEDPTGRFTHEALWPAPGLFSPLGERQPSFGATDSVWWFRFTLDNQGGREQDLIYSIRNPLLDDVRIEVRHQDGWVQRFRLGDWPIQPKVISHALDPAIPFEVQAGERVEILVSVRTTNFMTLGMWLADADAYSEVIRLRSMWHGGLIALFASLFLFNLFLIRRLRNPAFYWYVAFLPLMWLTVATEYGFAGVYLFPDSPWWRNQGMVLLAGLMYVASTGFAYAFLDLKASRPLRRTLGVLMLLALVQCLSAVALPLHTGFQLLSYCMAIFPLGLFAVSVKALWMGQVRARYLMLSQAASWVTQLVFGAWVLGWLPYHWFYRNALAIGLATDALFMAVALADWIGLIQRDKRQAELAQRQMLERQQVELERLVAERTAQLEQARELAMSQARQDALTGTRNRRAVLEEGLREYAQAHRTGAPLSAAMVDIDHFKQVNDEGGHAQGDRVLIAVVQCLTDTLRAGDLLGRWGGEEFVILMPNTGLAGARAAAERCRAAIEARISRGQGRKPVTASFGVTTLSRTDATLEVLIGRADDALYRAKSAGRNRVEACAAPAQDGRVVPVPAGTAADR